MQADIEEKLVCVLGVADRCRNSDSERDAHQSGRNKEKMRAYKRELRELINQSISFEEVATATPKERSNKLDKTIRSLLARGSFHLSRREQDLLVKQLIDDMFGLGPLEPLVADPAVSDIMINGPKHVFVERGGS